MLPFWRNDEAQAKDGSGMRKKELSHHQLLVILGPNNDNSEL